MAKPKKDAKAKSAEKKARKEAATKSKSTKSEKKRTVKAKASGDSDDDDVDLEAVLAEYAKQQAEFFKVSTEDACDPPSPRTASTFIASPTNSNELLIFGGEIFDGSLARFFNDLYVFSRNRATWKKVTSPNSPLPRSGHAWTVQGQAIYLYGGEFSSPKQGTFYHYNDLWRLDPADRTWTKLETKGKGPPARSGHRMTSWKHYVILFGGFQDTGQTKYLHDTWIYDCREFKWFEMSSTQKPDARSSFSLLPHDNSAAMFGGYSRIKGATKQAKGTGPANRPVLKPVYHQDTWFLRIKMPTDEARGSAPTVNWERRKKPANQPSPRTGATMVFHKGRGISFGGVHDVEESEEGISSEFFNELYAWNIDRNRFFPLTLRKPRGPPKKAVPAAERSGGRRGRGKADEEELLKNLAALETRGKIAEDVGDVRNVMPNEEMDKDPEPTPTPNQVISMTMPHPRFNAQLAVSDDVLYIFGGTFESGDREYTFDEMHSIDLVKLDGVREIFRRELADWIESEDEDEGSDDDEEEEEDEDDDEADETGSQGVPLPKSPTIAEDTMSVTTANESVVSETTVVDDEEAAETSSLTDDKPHPRPFESLRAFFERTSAAWQEIILERLRYKHGSEVEHKSVKEWRKDAFAMAEDKWWDCREEITRLEEEHEEAGIGEVVSLADKDETTGVGRRR